MIRKLPTIPPITADELRQMKKAARRQVELATPHARAVRIPSKRRYNRRRSNAAE